MSDIKTVGIIVDNESQESPRILFNIAQWDSAPWGKVANGWDSEHIEADIGVLNNVVDTKLLTVKVKASEVDALNAYIVLEKAETFGEKRNAVANKEGVLDKFQLNIVIDHKAHTVTFKEPKVILSKTVSENRMNFLVFTVKTKLPPIKNGAAI